MNIIASEQIMCVDIDNTILIWSKTLKSPKDRVVDFKDPYSGEVKSVKVHKAHEKILRDRLVRGATVFVWSASGYMWAAEAMKAIGLSHPNLYICSKPIGYLDDKPCQEWMGERIYLLPDDGYGQA